MAKASSGRLANRTKTDCREDLLERISKRSASSDAVVNKANVEKVTELNSNV